MCLGPTGTFDDSGVTSGCLVNHGGKKYLYYSGWTLGVTVPFYFYIGLAVSEDGGRTFQKVSPAPVLGRTATDPYLTASPSVIVEGGVWRMWYVSCVRWEMEGGQPKHYYHVKYAESADGIRWGEERRVSIDFQGADEYAIGRPCVRKDGGVYRMWYCYRGANYRIGYAESADGNDWTRRDGDAGIGYSASGLGFGDAGVSVGIRRRRPLVHAVQRELRMGGRDSESRRRLERAIPLRAKRTKPYFVF